MEILGLLLIAVVLTSLGLLKRYFVRQHRVYPKLTRVEFDDIMFSKREQPNSSSETDK